MGTFTTNPSVFKGGISRPCEGFFEVFGLRDISCFFCITSFCFRIVLTVGKAVPGSFCIAGPAADIGYDGFRANASEVK